MRDHRLLLAQEARELRPMRTDVTAIVIQPDVVVVRAHDVGSVVLDRGVAERVDQRVDVRFCVPSASR
jgi:hypothetical protein